MAQFLLVTDLDNTLVGDDAALGQLNQRISEHRSTFGTRLVYSTGRSHQSYLELARQKRLLPPDALITGVGTAIRYSNDGEPDGDWSAVLQNGWDRDLALNVASHFADLVLQPESEQSQFKLSYFLSEEIAPDVLPRLTDLLKEAELQFNLIYSGRKDLDILPASADKGMALNFLINKWQCNPARTITCGDSGNDRALLSISGTYGIIVGNAYPELLEWHRNSPSPQRYLANQYCAAGILEGLRHFGFL